MQTRTIPREQWGGVLNSISRTYEGSTSTLEILTDDRGAQIEVEEEPLYGITCDDSGIALILATGDGQRIAHRIPRPKAVQIEEGDNGLIAALGIQSSDETAVLRMHPPDPHKLLDEK